MLINREHWKSHRVWVIGFAIGTILAICACLNFGGRFGFPGGSSTSGYLLGLAAASIIIFEVLLWPRKKLWRHLRIGRVRTWMAAHIWLGLLTVPLAIAHAGIPWGGTLASATMLMLFLVVGSGIFGLAMQQYLPRKMIQVAAGETIYSQITAVKNQMIAEADALLSATLGQQVGETDWSELYPADKGGTDGVNTFVGSGRSIANIFGTAVVTKLPTQPIADTSILKSAYETTIRDYLWAGRQSSSLLKDSVRQGPFFVDLLNRVPEEADFVVNHLESWCDERRQLDVQQRLHHWLHYWLAVHLPLSLALLLLLVWHAFAASRYSGIF